MYVYVGVYVGVGVYDMSWILLLFCFCKVECSQ